DGDATFNSLADMLQNIPFKSDGPPSLAGISPHNNRTSIFAVYIQDDWHARAGLTLNLGLRYEMSTIPTEVQGKIANLPTIYTNPNTGPFNKVYFTSNPTTKNFEPRIGFAWDPFHNGKTSIRGGFGVFDVLPLPYELVINNAQTSPFAVTPTLVNPPQGSFPHELAGLFASPPSTNQTWNYVEPNPKRNYVYQWNFNVQRQITPNTSITLAYVGSRGLHNPFQIDDINTVFPTLTPAGYLFPNPVGSGTPLNPYVGGIQTTIWQSKAWYNSFQAEINKRLSHGFQVQASYTWSKTMDTSSGSFAGDNYAGDLSPTIPWWNLSIVKGLADFNVGRNLVLNGLWRIPTPTSFSGTAGWIARGWQVGGVLTLSDGVPVWPLWGVEGDPMGQLNFEPIGIEDRLTGGGCTSLISPGDVQYIKPQCLIVPIAPSQAFWAANCDPQPLLLLFNDPTKVSYPTCFNLMGNLGRNTVVGPGEANLDFSIVKDNPIKRFSESFDIQFRAEFFNILNRANFAPPVDNLEAIDSTGVQIPGFGTLDNTQTDPRDIQFALKIIW
ncbi:MAG: TonB-dependent receptor domain-containing protein, partial [Ktedonobacteraceae bacterium]